MTGRDLISSRRSPRILLAGGGTGGHVYPAIAIADAVRRRNPRAVIAFAGSPERIEWESVPRAGYPIHRIPARGLERRLSAKSVRRNAALPFVLVRGLRRALDLVKNFDADVVVGTGGFVALPVLLAARLQNRCVVIQEQNAHTGMTNRIAARFADQIHVAFEEAADELPPDRTQLSGNPVRPELARGDRTVSREAFGLAHVGPILLVLGGSGGSRPLNRAVERLLPELFEAVPDAGVLWQTGRAYQTEVARRVDSRSGLNMIAFIDRMDQAYAAADLALCRAGALTCSELMLTGTPALLVPSPHVAEDHQTKNAESLTRSGGARLLPESELDERLSREVIDLLKDAEARSAMAQKLCGAARRDAADTIARDILRLVEVTA